MTYKHTRRGFTQINHVILNLIQDLVVQIFKEVRFQIKFGMTPLLNNGGFTLIELLVVVLIIGILAAVALPQYQLAIVKSKISAYLPLVKSMADANEVYYLENGRYAFSSRAQDLDIKMPSSCVYRGNNTWPCGTDFLFDFSDQDAILLHYCPGYAQQDFVTCASHQELHIAHSYQQKSQAQILRCHNSTPFGRKLCKALGL